MYVAMGVIGLVVAGLGLVIDLATPLMGMALGVAYPVIRTLWGGDSTAGGERLRRIVPLRRRDVVTARYLAAAGLYGLLLAPYLVVTVIVGLVTDRSVGEPLFGVWLAASVATAAVLAAMPWAALRGPGLAFLALLSGGFAAAIGCLALWSIIRGDGYTIQTSVDAVVALSSFAVLLIVGGALSHGFTVRHYERKDLS